MICTRNAMGGGAEYTDARAFGTMNIQTRIFLVHGRLSPDRWVPDISGIIMCKTGEPGKDARSGKRVPVGVQDRKSGSRCLPGTAILVPLPHQTVGHDNFRYPGRL